MGFVATPGAGFPLVIVIVLVIESSPARGRAVSKIAKWPEHLP
jgi:hypothetical protein